MVFYDLRDLVLPLHGLAYPRVAFLALVDDLTCPRRQRYPDVLVAFVQQRFKPKNEDVP